MEPTVRIRPAVVATVLVVAANALTSCSARTAELRLPLDLPPAFSEPGAVEAPQRWWTAFEDAALNEVVEEALRSNLGLEATWQRLREARAIARRASSSLHPELDAFVEGEATGGEPGSPGPAESAGIRLGLAAEYEVDLWGRVRAEARAERHRALASLADHQAAAITVAAEVVRTWYRLMEALGQRALLDEQIETNEQLLRLIEARFGLGQTRSVDILRQRQLLESTREQAFSVEERTEVLEHQLAVLVGRPPQERLPYVAKALADLAPPPATGLPGELVLRRPDVLGAHRRLQAADGDLAAAISNRYPRLTLSATASTRTGSLLGDWMGSLLGSLVGPLLDGGERSAEIDRTEAVARRRLYEYAQAVLTALREVEDALVQEQKRRARIQSLERQVRLSDRAYQRLRIEYLNGVSDYIDVLTALAGGQRLRRDLLSARLGLIEVRIALHRALAGGFETGREVSLE